MSSSIDDNTALKRSLRSLQRGKREVRRADDRRSAEITQGIAAFSCELLRQVDATCCATYVPLPTEVGDLSWVETLADACATLLVPRCRLTGDGGRTLEWGRYAGRESLAPGHYGILEPHTCLPGQGATPLWDEGVTLLFVPAIAVDLSGRRLGQGAGYYDRLLSQLEDQSSPHHPVLCAAVVAQEDILPRIPVESHDRPVDWIVTESGLVCCDDVRRSSPHNPTQSLSP